MTRTCRLALGVAAILLAPAAVQAAPDQKRTYRKLTLDNGLKVVLTSDPKANISAASMAVGIGANADPKDTRGLAHFLEHMLFLANKKYPKLNDYSEFLRSRGGFSNAYTAADHTNYHFQVNHDGLPEALDRFAQFFISPTLDYKYAQREMMAVNSEHQKNILDDTWRVMQLQRASIKAGHPANGFSTGTKDTLAGAKEAVLRKFFDDYYGPDNLALAVISNLSLDRLEKLVRERFAGIKQRKVKEFKISPDLLDEVPALRLFKVAPVKDLRQLKLYFEVPPQHEKALHKTSTIIGMTMGDEGKGSLLSYLKQLGLANTLSAGVQDTRWYAACHVTVGLSKKGVQEWKKVLRLCFAYIAMLKRSKFPQHVWEEMRTMAKLRQLYSAKPEGTQAAIDLANTALGHGLELAEKLPYTFKAPDPAGWKALVGAMRPENCLAFLVAKGVPTDKKEKYYGTPYSFTEEKGELYQSLAKVEVPEQLHLPRVNPFIPKNVSLQAEQPVRIRKDGAVSLWYAQDTEFKRPKVAVHLHVLSPNAFNDVRAAALTQLLAATIKEQLNEYSYPALMAGLGWSLSATRQGVMLTVGGYSDSAFKLLEIVGKSLKGELSEAAFKTVKDRMVRGLKNFQLGQAYLTIVQYNRRLTIKDYHLPWEILEALEPVTLDDLRKHRTLLLSQTHIEGLAAGNLTAKQAGAAVEGFRQTLGSKPFAPEQSSKDEILFLQKGDDLVFKAVHPTNNACLRIDYQVGKSDLKTRMAAQIIARAIQNAFYTEMRTRQKLGYIVFSGTYNRKNVQNQVFIIQSGTHESEDLRKRAEAFIGKIPNLFSMIPPSYFNAIRNSLIKDRLKKPKTIAAKAGRWYGSAFEFKGDFGYLPREIAALKALTRDEVVAIVQKTFSPETRRRVTILLNAKQQGPHKDAGNVTDLSKFHQGRTHLKEVAGRK